MSSVISVCGRAGEWEIALQIMEEAQEWIDPNAEQGTVFFDTDPNDDEAEDSGGTLGERLGF